MGKKGTFLFIVLAALMAAGCKPAVSKKPVDLIPVAQSAINDTTSIYYRDFTHYSDTALSQLPIGVFDSGSGGMNVIEELLALDNHDNITGELIPDGIPDFAGEGFQYLDDDANMPYNNYLSENNADYLRELVVKDVLFLMGRHYFKNNIEDMPSGDKSPVKLIVVACNTASAYGMSDAQNMLSAAGCDIRMIGVIDAGVAAALQDIPDKGHFAVGVMSNSVTLESRIYSREIADSAAARKVRIDLVEQDCGSLDAAINVGSDSASAKAKSAFKELVDKYLATGPSVPMKCVILGSTHLPFVMDALNEELDELRNFRDKDDRAVYREIIADDFVFIDPSEYTAMACYNYLRSHKLLSLSSKKQTLCTYLSVPSYKLPEGCVDTFGNLTYNFKYGRQVGTEEVTTKQVPLSATRMDIESFSAIHGRLPHAYSMILKNIQH
jgi:Glutamate racemase